jgi:hypothetical protein
MGSAEERLQSELWRGAVPVEVHLALDEVADTIAPPPMFALVPRGAYLPLWSGSRHSRALYPKPQTPNPQP